MSNSLHRIPPKTVFDKYYEDQAGGGISSWYKGNSNQRGHGIGSFLGGLYRVALPLLKSGARTIGKEFLNSGINVLNDMDSEDTDLRNSIKQRSGEAVGNLKRQAKEKVFGFLRGEGYKIKRRRKTNQSKLKKSRKKSQKQKTLSQKRKRKSGKSKRTKKKLNQAIRKKKTKRIKKRIKKRKTKSKPKSRNKYDILSNDIFS